jgi:hypothetical protein
LGSGAADGWEVLQFKSAQMTGVGTFALSELLRGQFGTWATRPAQWPAGSKVVLLNALPKQLNLPSTSRGTARHFRFGPARQPLGDPSYRYATHVFAGNGLRPYPVVHLRATRTGGAVAVQWIRCTRIDGDLWADSDVPLGEDSESYRVTVLQAGQIKREATVHSPFWQYDAADRTAEVGTDAFDIKVAQISARFGVGPAVACHVPPA